MDIAITAKLASLIDHTLLKPNGSETDHVQLCDEAKEWCFRTVCVFPQFVELCVSELNQSPTEVCTVIDFPRGLGDIEKNVDDVCMVTSEGVMEIDLVMDMDAFRSNDYDKVAAGIYSIVEAAEGRIVKVIIESCLWEDEQIQTACEIVKEAKAQFVKASTGFSNHGATTNHIKLMRETVGDLFGVKASGGIKTFQDAFAMIQAGANRIGTSSSIEIMKGSYVS
jgi:deoxyribose-phosphate aldolase